MRLATVLSRVLLRPLFTSIFSVSVSSCINSAIMRLTGYVNTSTTLQKNNINATVDISDLIFYERCPFLFNKKERAVVERNFFVNFQRIYSKSHNDIGWQTSYSGLPSAVIFLDTFKRKFYDFISQWSLTIKFSNVLIYFILNLYTRDICTSVFTCTHTYICIRDYNFVIIFCILCFNCCICAIKLMLLN